MADHKQLQLPSQRQLVERLQHLIEFNNPFVLLCGRAGSGRSTLLERLHEQLPESLRLITLVANPSMKMEQVREVLLRQVVPTPLFNPADALADSFLRMMQGTTQHCVILLDNIDLLPQELLGELWALMLTNDALAVPHRLAIVVTGRDTWCRQQITRLKGRTIPALELEVAPLSAPEQKIFLYEKGNQLKVPSLLLTKEKVTEILARAGGHPGTIMTFLEDLMTDRRPRKRPEPFPIRKAALVLAGVALGLLALTYLVPGIMGTDEPVEPKVEQPAGTLPPPVPETPVQGEGQPTLEGGSAAAPAGAWKSEQPALPNQVEGDTITAQSQNYEGRRVVIGDEVVQQLMKTRPASGALPAEVEQAVVPSKLAVTPPAVHSESKPAVQEAPKPAVKANKPAATAVATPTAATRVALTPASTLNQKSSRHFSVQLMGASNLKAVEAFVSAHQLGGKVWVYQTQFRGSPWYVVLQGDHASLEQARAAIRTLPPALLKEQPWPKSFAQVKKELKK